MQLVSFTPDVPPGKQVYSTSSDYDTDSLKSLELTSDKFQCLLTVVPPTYTTVYIGLFAHFTSSYWKSCTFLRSYWKPEVLHWAWGITIGQEELQLLWIIYIGTYQVDKTLHSALMAPYTLARIKVRHLATFFTCRNKQTKSLSYLHVYVAKSSGKKQTQTFIVADLLKIKVPSFSSSYSCRLLSYWACLQATGTPWKLLNDKDYSLCVCVCVCDG